MTNTTKTCHYNHIEISWESLLPGDDCPLCNNQDEDIIDELRLAMSDLASAKEQLESAEEEISNAENRIDSILDELGR